MFPKTHYNYNYNYPVLVNHIRVAYFARHNYRFEDVTAVAFANFLGRQFIDLGLAASTVINHFYACVKPAWFKFGINLKEDEFLLDILLAMKKERPGVRDVAAFPKWPLVGLLNFLNSSVFEQL